MLISILGQNVDGMMNNPGSQKIFWELSHLDKVGLLLNEIHFERQHQLHLVDLKDQLSQPQTIAVKVNKVFQFEA